MFNPQGILYLDGIGVGHTMFELATLINIIETYQPKNIVEIGLWQGGLSYILIQTFRDINYVGIEITCNHLHSDAKAVFTYPNTKLLCGDCFSKETRDFIQGLKGSKFIYCDGGNKAKEMKAYKYLVNVGDIIMCHDYWDGKSKVIDVPQPNAEVSPKDVRMYETGSKYKKLSLPGTRILGYVRTE